MNDGPQSSGENVRLPLEPVPSRRMEAKNWHGKGSRDKGRPRKSWVAVTRADAGLFEGVGGACSANLFLRSTVHQSEEYVQGP